MRVVQHRHHPGGRESVAQLTVVLVEVQRVHVMVILAKFDAKPAGQQLVQDGGGEHVVREAEPRTRRSAGALTGPVPSTVPAHLDHAAWAMPGHVNHHGRPLDPVVPGRPAPAPVRGTSARHGLLVYFAVAPESRSAAGTPRASWSRVATTWADRRGQPALLPRPLAVSVDVHRQGVRAWEDQAVRVPAERRAAHSLTPTTKATAPNRAGNSVD